MKHFVRLQLLGFIEGGSVGAAIAIAQNNYTWTALALGLAGVMFAYYDGKHGWSL